MPELRPDRATDTASALPLQVQGAQVRIRGKAILGPLDFSLSGPGISLVIGPNGAGKTTLLRLLHGLQRLNQGSVKWNIPTAAARKRQAFVFQTPIMMRRSVVDNIAYPLILSGLSRGRARQRAETWARDFGLGHVAAGAAPMLSGGEKQKLALARALIAQPDILFLDEPCANLDGRATRDIEAILQAANARGTRIVMATHDMGQARRLGSDVLFLCGGQLLETAPAAQFFQRPRTPQARAFLRGDIIE